MDLDLILRFGWRIAGILGVILVIAGKRSESSGVAVSGVVCQATVLKVKLN